MKRRNLSIVLGISLAFLFTKQDFALELNGTAWVGTVTCSGFNSAGHETFRSGKVPMTITQTGTEAFVTVNFGTCCTNYGGTVLDAEQNSDSRGFLGFV